MASKAMCVRRVLEPVARFAIEVGIPVIGNSHFRKGAGGKAFERVFG